MAMKRYPDAPEFTGLNAPLGEEYEVPDLAIEGRIPDDIEGVFFRAVPDPAFPPFRRSSRTGRPSCPATA
jgi:carotenoid cleavage dioxygenase-like enzyme